MTKKLKSKGKIFAYVWFDVEDFVTPESNDLPIVALDILNKLSIPVTCKIVAEKIRFLKENNRNDVISKLSKTDVGYHTDTHSIHPTLYEYEKDLDLIHGAEEFMKRESSGLAFLKDELKISPSCFGHAGPAWAPQVYPAMKEMGIPVYLDETPILNVGNSPYWYCGVLNLNGANKNFVKFDYTFNDTTGSERLKRKFRSIHDRLRKEGGGFISILFHLHTAINTEFWDAVNFADGKNTPKEDFVLPQRQPQKVTKRAWEDFEKLLEYASSFDDVEFITATDAAKLLRRKEKLVLDPSEIREISRNLSSKKLSFQKVGGELISPAQAFAAITNFLAVYSRNNRPPNRITVVEPLGPLETFESRSAKTVSTSGLMTAASDVSKFLNDHGYMPSRIDVGDSTLSPGDFLATLSTMILSIVLEKKVQQNTPLRRAKLDNSFINDQAFNDALEWKLFPRNFSAPKILEQIKLQTWTLVPATIR